MGSQECRTLGSKSPTRGLCHPVKGKTSFDILAHQLKSLLGRLGEVFGPEGRNISLLRKRAVELVEDISLEGFYNCLFIIPEATGGWRPVVDVSALNFFGQNVLAFLLKSVSSESHSKI